MPFSTKYEVFLELPVSAEIPLHQEERSTPNGIRTRAATLKGWCHSEAVLVSLLIKSIVEE